MGISIRILLLSIVLVCLSASPLTAEEKGAQTDALATIQEQIRELKEQMTRERRAYETKLQEMERRVETLSKKMAEKPEADPEKSLEGDIAQSTADAPSSGPETVWSSVGSAIQSMNPEIAVSIDTLYYNDNTENGVGEIIGQVGGFGHADSHEEDHGHAHYFDKGFNLRLVELYLGAAVDPYFTAYTTLGYHNGIFEVEEAVFQTTCLPAGFQVKGGKFLSDFSRINRQHPHEWDFVDRPLISALVFGSHGLLETGAQLSWLAPTPFHLLLGLEAAQGDNENTFNNIGGDHLPDHSGPRLLVGWLKCSPNLPNRHGLQMGLFGSSGKNQETDDGNEDGTEDHWLDGNSSFWGADFVYKYDAPKEHGQGDWIVQGEYLYRRIDLDVVGHDLNPALVGRSLVKNQDGFYIQGVYGFLPRWRSGLRWDMAGLTNEDRYPTGNWDDFGTSCRFSGMVDFSPSEFSRLRFQTSYGDWALADGNREDFWQVFVQAIVNIGAHGAHGF
ncbi:MAG: zinc-regulated TonB-dependent outer membrane receptor [Deltaproteobacteria bacterium]|jgi:hypothetical protein|nr:zinc-regulated TonB-dependent outer membrane receptor [Deltaproteobacteria bacterium]